MKLLTPQRTQEELGEQQTRSLLRSRELYELEQEFRLKTAKAEAEFNETLAKNRKVWEKEEAAHNARKIEMQKELAALEEQKRQTIIPFEILKQSSDERMKRAQEFVEEVEAKNERLEKLSELLEDKLDDVGNREISLKDREILFDVKEKGLNSQIESVKSQSALLSNEISKFQAHRTISEEDIKNRLNNVILRENSLNSREQEVLSKQNELKEREIRLADERDVLRRAWEEFKSMKVSP